MKYIDRFILLANLAVIVMTLLAYLAPSVNPNYTWVIAFFGLFYPLLILANVGFIMFWIFRKWTRIWPSLVCLLIGYNQFFGFIAFNAPKTETDSEYINIVNFNISNARFGYSKDKSALPQKRESMISYLQSFEDVDFFCLQEVGTFGTEVIHKSFGKKYQIYHKEGKGASIVSKYPILKKGEIDFGTKTNSCVWADIKLPYDTVRVYSYHLQSNNISRDAEKLASQSEIESKQAWYDIKGILRKFKNKHLKRAKQARLIAEHAEKSPYKTLVGGDLNDPPQSYTYKVLTEIGKDAFRSAGNGIGTTYHGVIPLLRIDYMFVDPRLEIHECEILKGDFSDHYPIKTTIRWPGI